MSDRVILIEFNELSPVLLHDFMAAGELPTFRRFHDESEVFTTDAEAAPPNLEPWIQWPSVHLGVTHREHGIRHLGDRDEAHRPVGELLSAAGVRVGICGSMNVPHRNVNGFSIPDPWNTETPTLPERLSPFHRTVSAMVQESSREDSSTPSTGVVSFLGLLVRHGLRPRTALAVARQLAAERRDPGVKWRRATVLDRLQYDLFRNLVRSSDARFATFFSNSTAHFQHYYWRNMAPTEFASPPDASEHESLKDAVRYGYRSMDRMLAELMTDFPDALLVLCTALSQEAWTESTKVTYRPRRLEDLLEYVGLAGDRVSVQPVMAEEFVVRFPSEAEALRGEELFARLRVAGGEQLLGFANEGDYLVGGCAVTDAGAMDKHIEVAGERRPERVSDLFYPIHTVRSGRHNPHGVLWWRTGRHRVVEEPVPLTAVAPTLLSLFGVGRPDYMPESELPLAELRPLSIPTAG
jgi:hypothetical protein